MNRVAVVTDSASDLPVAAAEAGQDVTVVPLIVSFGSDDFRTGVDITTDEFWGRLTAPGAPFPRTAAASPGTFQETFERLFAAGAEAIVYVGVGAKLSANLASAGVARDALADRDITLIDSGSASMGVGVLVEIAARMAADGAGAAEIAATLERRKHDGRCYVVLETLEYLRRGGRIGGAQAALGTLLSVKPIITIEDGVVETAERVRTRRQARARLVELLTARPIERLAVLHASAPDVEAFADELAVSAGISGEAVSVHLIGPAVGSHVGPGAYGAAVLYRSGTIP